MSAEVVSGSTVLIHQIELIINNYLFFYHFFFINFTVFQGSGGVPDPRLLPHVTNDRHTFVQGRVGVCVCVRVCVCVCVYSVFSSRTPSFFHLPFSYIVVLPFVTYLPRYNIKLITIFLLYFFNLEIVN